MRYPSLQNSLTKTLNKTIGKAIARTFSKGLLKASPLANTTQLMDATRLIQKSLAKSMVTPTQTAPNAKNSSPVTSRSADSDPTTAQNFVLVPKKAIEVGQTIPAPQREAGFIAQREAGFIATREASFTARQFLFEGNTYPYRLYIPSAPQTATGQLTKMPLVVLLHGCNQDALDFSHGTAMNRLAEDHHAMVLYPEQVASGNAMRCWNWFDPSHQEAGRGEPGMIAALVQSIVAQHSADPARTYVAGLSAGGAMAAVVANVYPQLFAAVGVHSGLAAGSAKSMMQALSAMKKGTKGNHTAAIPTIVFHGTADQTVNPSNGNYITQAALAAFEAEGFTLAKSQAATSTTKDERAERTLYSNANGKPFVESWRITAGTHAWSGGNALGSYTDPDGPDASKAMLAFFLQHSKGEATP